LALALYLALSLSADDFSAHGCPLRQSPPSLDTDRLRQDSKKGVSSLVTRRTQRLARGYGESRSGGHYDGLGLGFLYRWGRRSHCRSYFLGYGRIRGNGGLVVHASVSRFFMGNLFQLFLGRGSPNFAT